MLAPISVLTPSTFHHRRHTVASHAQSFNSTTTLLTRSRTMNSRQEITHKNSQPGGARSLRFATPLRKAFKRLNVARKKPAGGIPRPLADCSNTQPGPSAGLDAGEIMFDGKFTPPPAPRPSRLATPVAPPSPISPLPPSLSRSGNLMTTRSKEVGYLTSPSLPPASTMSDTMPESSSPMVPLPRGDLFQLGLTPIQSIQSIVDPECPVFAPALPTVQRVSSVNMARLTADVDMMDVMNMDLNDAGKAVTPTPPSRNTTQWIPDLIPTRKASNNLSTTAVFEGGKPIERRRSTFMSKLVGNGWGFSGLGFTSMSGHRRSHSAVSSSSVQKATLGEIGSLPSIPIGKRSIERAVFGSEAVDIASTINAPTSNRNSLVNGLPPANSTLRMTGSKSARALDNLDLEDENVEPRVNIEERPKKKRRSVAENLVRSTTPSPSPVRVTRAMAARQAEIEANTPTRITRSASKRLAELANSPTRKPNVVRSKSAKRL
ncbi:unnamed protein product [Rhizoctonia solani]|uniref:Uncharacterized protein n=1 Tax=Rhizoctonia solani TaxID=456999 RepID=A0A8H3E5W6_9AGAM|nr:unnamed protein product [Rhizoctonia solani]